MVQATDEINDDLHAHKTLFLTTPQRSAHIPLVTKSKKVFFICGEVSNITKLELVRIRLVSVGLHKGNIQTIVGFWGLLRMLIF